MAEYYNISVEEMDKFLIPQGFQKIQLPGTVELVYGKRVDINGIPLTMRIYTGIDPNGLSRNVGEDAMRVNLFTKINTGEIKKILGSKRVHRVKGWAKNLQARINDMIIAAQSIKICQKCGLPMVLREGQSKGRPYKFYGCSGWPACTFTISQ